MLDLVLYLFDLSDGLGYLSLQCRNVEVVLV